MPPVIQAQCLRLVPVVSGDKESIGALMGQPEPGDNLWVGERLARESLCTMIAESVDPAAITSLWRIEAGPHGGIGWIGLRPLSTAALRLRAIGWRSLELLIAIELGFSDRGFACQAVEAVAVYAGRDGVTFALVAAVDEQNHRAHKLMQRCGFLELGQGADPAHPVVIYELAV
jgi:RimJ/RimL family protein N-acetyltransferase